jgi:glycosyltransferase involved in cell wall biosynthesis
MSTTPLTVGIPTYNRAALLTRAIDSVLAQSFTAFRLIVSDNASEDRTAETVAAYADERIEYLRSEHNVGPIANLNGLIARADTEYLVLLPDDDILLPGHLAATLAMLQRCPSVGLVHSAYQLIDADSRVLRRVHPRPFRAATVDPRERALEHLMASPGGLCFSTIAYRTRAIVAAGGFQAHEEPFGDRQLWMRIALEWDFGYLPQPLAGFRAHPDTVSTNVATRRGIASDGREGSLLYAELNFQRRLAFLADAPLTPERGRRLRGLAELQRLVDRASEGLPTGAVTRSWRHLVRAHPELLRRRATWRLLLAQLGGRRARAVLRGGPLPRRRVAQS